MGESPLDLTLRTLWTPPAPKKRRVTQHAGRIGVRPPKPACKMPLQADPKQPALPEIDPGEPASRAQELDELAFAFVTTHAWFWKLFVRFVQDAREAGSTIGAKAVVERIRWEHTTRRSLQKHDFAVNNTLAASFARIYVRTYPEHAACFEMRKRPSAEVRARGGIT